MKATKSKGFVLSVVSTILALISFIVYRNVLHKYSAVPVLIAAAVILGVVTAVLAIKIGGKEITNVLPLISSVIFMLSAGLATMPMVEEIGFVISGLNPVKNIQVFIIFMVITLVAWLANVITAFAGVVKEEKAAISVE